MKTISYFIKVLFICIFHSCNNDIKVDDKLIEKNIVNYKDEQVKIYKIDNIGDRMAFNYNDTVYVIKHYQEGCGRAFPIFSENWLGEKNLYLQSEDLCRNVNPLYGYRVSQIDSVTFYHEKYYIIRYESGLEILYDRNSKDIGRFMTRIILYSPTKGIIGIDDVKPDDNKVVMSW